MNSKDVVILSVPYCEPYPLVAPALLSSCLEKNNIKSIAVDFNIQFLKFLSDKSFFTEFKTLLTLGHLTTPNLVIDDFKVIFKFTKNFLKKLVETHNPKYIGLSIFTSESLDFGIILSYVIRKYFPTIKIIIGGKGIENKDQDNIPHYQKWFDNNIGDLIIVGDAESEIVESIKKEKTGLIFCKKQNKNDLDNIPYASWKDYDLNEYKNLIEQGVATDEIDHKRKEPYLSVTASKGCVRKCTFCDVASFWPTYVFRDPIKVANEMIHNYRSTGIRKFLFTDNLINGSVTNFRKMNEVLADTIPREIGYHGYAIFRGKHQMPEADFELASLAGNKSWSVGVESGSERIRAEMKKKFDDDDLDHSVNMLIKYDIQQKWLIMVGYPSETEKDFEKTKNLIRRYKKFAHDKKIIVQVTPTFVVLNNSPLVQNQELAQKYGLEHVKNAGPMESRFWKTEKYPQNDYPTRSRWWKELMKLIEDCGYSFGDNGLMIEKWKEEISYYDKLYEQKK